MNGDVRRASAFFAVGLLSLVAPAISGRPTPQTTAILAALPFAIVAGAALFAVGEGRTFDLFARPGDYEERRLFGLGGFALAAAGLALLATRFGMPTYVFVGSVFVITGGNLAGELAKSRTGDEFLTTAAFAAGGFVAGIAGELGALFAASTWAGEPLTVVYVPLVFLAAAGALAAALLRSMLFERDDPIVMVSVALLLWLFVELNVAVGTTRLAFGLAVTVLLGFTAHALGTASVPGMLTGVLLALLAIVLGGYGWFALLITFFGLGGLSTKYRYEEKKARGIAEANEGARGSGNVLANSAVALVVVLLFAASDRLFVPPDVFRLAFTGAVATALADTFSSEFGGLFDEPRLVTTFERVRPGTDGGVTWQGELAGIAGAAIIAAIGAVFFGLGPVAWAGVVAAGFLGMTADSVFGATVEGDHIGNQEVNLLATLVGALAAAGLAVVLPA